MIKFSKKKSFFFLRKGVARERKKPPFKNICHQAKFFLSPSPSSLSLSLLDTRIELSGCSFNTIGCFCIKGFEG